MPPRRRAAPQSPSRWRRRERGCPPRPAPARPRGRAARRGEHGAAALTSAPRWGRPRGGGPCPVPRREGGGRAGARDDRRPGEPGAGHARQPDLRRRLPAAAAAAAAARRPAQAAGVPHAARVHRHRQQLLHQPAARGGGRAALRPAGLLPLRGRRRRPLLGQGRLRPGLRGRVRLLRALRRQGLPGQQRPRREGGLRAGDQDSERQAEESAEAADHLLQLPAGGPAAALPENPVPRPARESGAGGLPGPHPDAGEDLVPEPPFQVQEDVEERRDPGGAPPAPQRLAAAPRLAPGLGLRRAPAHAGRPRQPQPRRRLPRHLPLVPDGARRPRAPAGGRPPPAAAAAPAPPRRRHLLGAAETRARGAPTCSTGALEQPRPVPSRPVLSRHRTELPPTPPAAEVSSAGPAPLSSPHPPSFSSNHQCRTLLNFIFYFFKVDRCLCGRPHFDVGD